MERKMKLEFKNGYIELNQDGTKTIVGECAHTYYFTLIDIFRKAGLSLEETMEEIKNIFIEEIAINERTNDK